jgi:hypothetical protein
MPNISSFGCLLLMIIVIEGVSKAESSFLCVSTGDIVRATVGCCYDMSRVCRVYIVVVVVYSEKYKRKKGKRLPLVVLTARPPFLFPLGQLLCKKDPRAPATKTRTKIEQVKAILYYY